MLREIYAIIFSFDQVKSVQLILSGAFLKTKTKVEDKLSLVAKNRNNI